ncbi:carbohydrate ABC transporter permease [Leifsonia shinshuensis]|uniref:carbohydrate ABC transporter permease n=1 Tax=Leifsonia shinshuensis TaxID=150026 RepID=UPI001F5150C4|nr:carbohydrate ABC transporter permease [Leifsonia shinshuensis]MCI0157764.1 carbohydrate ABC transporter permease [Leifsonia shinshuensis]
MMTIVSEPTITETRTGRPVGATRKRRRRPPRIGRVFAFLGLLVLGVSTIYPFVFLIETAFKTRGAYLADRLSFPIPPTLDNFQAVFTSGNIGLYVLNSVIVVVLGTAITVVLGSMAGFAFSLIPFPFSQTLLRVVMAIMILPVTVLIIPIFKVVLDIGLIDTHAGLVLVYVGLSLPFATFMMSSYFTALPSEIIDAARIDGCNTWRLFWSIAIPVAKPAFLTLSSFTFLNLWNDLLFALLILQSPDKRTLPVAISLLRGSVERPDLIQDTVVAAGVLVSAVVPFVLFVLFNRSITSGLTAGALK